MKKPREPFESELAEIREELLRLGVRPKDNPTEPAISVTSEEQIITPPALMTAAYELAGYAVATRVLGRRIPDKVVLKEDREYDLGRCSERELDTIWAVGHMAGERSRNYGCSGEQGLIGISASMENRIADPMELNYPGAEVIVNEDWDAIVCVARLLTERGILSRSELENEIFGSDIKMRVCLMRADEMFGICMGSIPAAPYSCSAYAQGKRTNRGDYRETMPFLA